MSHDAPTLSTKQLKAIAKVQKLLAKAQALQAQMDTVRLEADKAVSKLDEHERDGINRSSINMPKLGYNCDMETVIEDLSWGDYLA